MVRVLLIGYMPDAVDYSDPALPPGMDAGKIEAGIELGLKQMRDRGWEADHCLIRPETAGPEVERKLSSDTYDCIVIGGGVRMSQRLLAQFEAVINAVHRKAPTAAIAFNTKPDDSADAAARWVLG